MLQDQAHYNRISALVLQERQPRESSDLSVLSTSKTQARSGKKSKLCKGKSGDTDVGDSRNRGTRHPQSEDSEGEVDDCYTPTSSDEDQDCEIHYYYADRGQEWRKQHALTLADFTQEHQQILQDAIDEIMNRTPVTSSESESDETPDGHELTSDVEDALWEYDCDDPVYKADRKGDDPRIVRSLFCSRMKILPFLMGLHPRLGAASLIKHLDLNLVEKIVSYASPAATIDVDEEHHLEPFLEFMGEQRQDVDGTLAMFKSDDSSDDDEEEEDTDAEELGFFHAEERRRRRDKVNAISEVLAELIDVDSEECATGGASSAVATRSRRARTMCDAEAAEALATVSRDFVEATQELAVSVRGTRQHET